MIEGSISVDHLDEIEGKILDIWIKGHCKITHASVTREEGKRVYMIEWEVKEEYDKKWT